MYRFILLLAATCVLGGCATPPPLIPTGGPRAVLTTGIPKARATPWAAQVQVRAIDGRRLLSWMDEHNPSSKHPGGPGDQVVAAGRHTLQLNVYKGTILLRREVVLNCAADRTYWLQAEMRLDALSVWAEEVGTGTRHPLVGALPVSGHAPRPAPVNVGPAGNVTAALIRLQQLRAAGRLDAESYAQKRAELLGEPVPRSSSPSAIGSGIGEGSGDRRGGLVSPSSSSP